VEVLCLVNHVIKKRRLKMHVGRAMRKNVFGLICLVCSILFLLCYASKAISSERKVINWNISLWGGPQAWSYPLERFAKDMETKTNGGWKIKIHYGDALSPGRENLDGLKAGLFEGCSFCAMYHPGKTPLHTVVELPFITKGGCLQNSQMLMALWEHPALLKELERWNAVPLLPVGAVDYVFSGNRRIASVADLKGARVRISGDKGRVIEQFGAAPTMMPGSEIYEALSRGTIDTVSFCYPHCFGHFKTYEVSKYIMPALDVGTVCCTFVANKKAYDALPDEYKQYHREWYKKAPQEAQKDIDEAFDKWIPEYKEKMEFVEFPPAEYDKLVAKAKPVWEGWVKRWSARGLPAQEVLDYFLSKRKEIMDY
jgi:TRAP-type mannitol/chloroaromatic compound transport system substrate-binding protein